ncbi:MAG: hypothetical protein Kow0074_06750 [Candidatus Zixiibacteriota bacterium]
MEPEVEMSEDQKLTEYESHEKFARDCFNYVWELLQNEDRTIEEDDEMVHAAHASRFHWGKIGDAVHRARGEWQISRVYAELNSPEPSKYHALRCLSLCQENNLSAFDHAYAYEALARAAAVGRNKTERDQNLARAREAAEGIDDEESKNLLLNDLKSIA